MLIKVLPTPENLNYLNIQFEVAGQFKGFGYLVKADKTIGLIRCPKCETENYALSVSAGVCAFCGFDVNEQEIEISRQLVG